MIIGMYIIKKNKKLIKKFNTIVFKKIAKKLNKNLFKKVFKKLHSIFNILCKIYYIKIISNFTNKIILYNIIKTNYQN